MREDLKALIEQIKGKEKIQDSFANVVSYGNNLLMLRCLDDKIEENHLNNCTLAPQNSRHLLTEQTIGDLSVLSYYRWKKHHWAIFVGNKNY